MVVSQKVLLRERKNNGRELLIHLLNLREKTQSLSFLSDLGSLWIELSLLAPRNEERGARSEERQLYSQVMILMAGFALLTLIK